MEFYNSRQQAIPVDHHVNCLNLLLYFWYLQSASQPHNLDSGKLSGYLKACQSVVYKMIDNNLLTNKLQAALDSKDKQVGYCSDWLVDWIIDLIK